jgi:tRNA(Ile)-lysidine synthase
MSPESSGFCGDLLAESLAHLPTPPKYWLGFSGGADSTALLHALHEIRDRVDAPLEAVHFDHGLHAESDTWARHCRAFCLQRDIPFRALRLDIRPDGPGSLEEAGRNGRYRAIERLLGDGDLYLTAHHAEDQAETLLLNLMRGSGIEGLAGIPILRELGRGWVARPLLDVHRDDLLEYLRQRHVEWLEDPSNQDNRFDRNFLRNEVIPLLEQRWPGLSRRLARTARNARVNASALAAFIEDQSGDLLGDRFRMPALNLLRFDQGMQALVLRQWLRRHEIPLLPEARLRDFLVQLADARPDARAEVQWADWMIKRYRNDLWLHRREPYAACPDKPWTSGMDLELGKDSGLIRLAGGRTAIPAGWRVGSRRPGDRIRPLEGGPSRKLKLLFQAASIPPWLRLGIPVLYWDDEAVALGDWVLGYRLRCWLAENGLELKWKPADPVLERVRRDCQG